MLVLEEPTGGCSEVVGIVRERIGEELSPNSLARIEDVKEVTALKVLVGSPDSFVEEMKDARDDRRWRSTSEFGRYLRGGNELGAPLRQTSTSHQLLCDVLQACRLLLHFPVQQRRFEYPFDSGSVTQIPL